jgi:hypothetical protein
MTAAGLDPSRIQERAVILAKVQAVKRKRAAEMDVDMDEDQGEGEGEDNEGDWMDVDGEDKPSKRVKGNSGGVVAVDRRGPRTNRQFAGMRDEAVRQNISCPNFSLTPVVVFSKHPGLSNCATLGRDPATCLRKLARAIVQSGSKWYVVIYFVYSSISSPYPII